MSKPPSGPTITGSKWRRFIDSCEAIRGSNPTLRTILSAVIPDYRGYSTIGQANKPLDEQGLSFLAPAVRQLAGLPSKVQEGMKLNQMIRLNCLRPRNASESIMHSSENDAVREVGYCASVDPILVAYSTSVSAVSIVSLYHL